MGSNNMSFRNIEVDESNILFWSGLLVPDKAPYNKGAFLINLEFPAEYPFKPPKVNFKTPIYHPNIDERADLAEEFTKDKKKFLKKAEEFTLKNSAKRPVG